MVLPFELHVMSFRAGALRDIYWLFVIPSQRHFSLVVWQVPVARQWQASCKPVVHGSSRAWLVSQHTISMCCILPHLMTSLSGVQGGLNRTCALLWVYKRHCELPGLRRHIEQIAL